MLSIMLDVVYGEDTENETLEDELRELVSGLDIETRVVNEHGPGGGWPVVEFITGSDSSMRELLNRYHRGDLWEINYFLVEYVVEVNGEN